MKKLDINTRTKPNPILEGLPEALKDPTRFVEIETRLFTLLSAKHRHRLPSEWMRCRPCQKRFKEKQAEMVKMGFRNIGQFYLWRKIMNIMITKKDFQV